MHGCGPGSALLVNAEVDSMGGVVDGGVGIGLKTSPRRVAIERAQAELRQEYDVREERRRELEFLEKGGNPLDFKLGNAASVSVQSTSLTENHTEHFVTSEAKGSFALTASPHGDSVESIGRPGALTVCEPNSADNFDGENELLEGEKDPKNPRKRNNIVSSEQSSQMDGTQNAKESEDSAIVRPYARRNRSRPNREGGRSNSTDAVHSSGGHGASLLVRMVSREAKGSVSEVNNLKENATSPVSHPKSITSNGDIVHQIENLNNQSNMEVEGAQALEPAANLSKGSLPEDTLEVREPDVLRDNHPDQVAADDIQKTSINLPSGEQDQVDEKELLISAALECPPCADTLNTGNEDGSVQLNGFSGFKRDANDDLNGNVVVASKALDSESSCTQPSLSLDVNNDNNLCNNCKNSDSNGSFAKLTPECEGMEKLVAGEIGNEKNEDKAIDSSKATDEGHSSAPENNSDSVPPVKIEEESHVSLDALNETKCPDIGVEQNDDAASEADNKIGSFPVEEPGAIREMSSSAGPQSPTNVPIKEVPESILSEKNSSAAPDPPSCPEIKLPDKALEDSILEEARIIEAKRKRIAELAVGTVAIDTRRKSHWDFVIEEMAWLANDFAQERLWKITAAAQICRRVAFASKFRFEEQNQQRKMKRVAYDLANAVMQFWQSAEVLLNSGDERFGLKSCKYELRNSDGQEFEKQSDVENLRKNRANEIQGYAVRFLKCNSTSVPSLQAEGPATPDRIADLGTVETSWDDNLTEESLFYAVPSGAMEAYRTSIESHLIQCEKTGSSLQEEVDTSIFDAGTEFGYHDNTYDEEEGETSAYVHGGFESSKSTKHDNKKRKILTKSLSARSNDLGTDTSYGPCTVGSQQNTLFAKRPASNLNVGAIPTKRMRTANRQRVISPLTTASTGGVQAPVKTDASSGDTSSFQDDHSTLNGGSQMQKSMEVESVGDFEKQLPFDCADVSKLKKKKKAKHLQGSAYEPGWQMDSAIHNELRDNIKKRFDHFDSNGTSGFYGPHTAKKPKIMKQPADSCPDAVAQMTGSIPSPAASQMSNMSNTNRLIKLIGGRDKGRKPKLQKMSAVQQGSGSAWSLFEDQALVVLVHDMGPNWELVSDAINSTLQFKCIFRKPKECKERHKILMDKGGGDGADSAEDSGSSQSYPSTLPGIPKGSARQLFQRLQGPMEEDTLKSHFEKIIVIGKKLHCRRSQGENQDLKQIAPVHNSHVIALSQVCPNNLNGGVLNPLDLCESTASSPDVHSLGYPGSHSSGLALPSQVVSSSITSGANLSLQGSSGMGLGNNSSPSGPLAASVRDGRYNVSRTSVPVDEQQRMQHYNHMLSVRNVQQPNLSVSGPVGGADRGVRMLPGGNGMGVVPGMSRSMPMARPGFPAITSSPTVNNGSMLSSSMVGMPSPVSMHSGSGSSQGNSMIRPREALHMVRPGGPSHNPEHQRQMMVPELQMQVTQGNSQGIPAFNGLTSAFANPSTPSPVQSYPAHPQQQQHHQMSGQHSHLMNNPHHHLQGPNHGTGSQQQAYARLVKDRQMQQRLLQQQQQFAASGPLVPNVQAQSQLPLSSSSMQNSSQIQPQASSQSVSMSPLAPSSPMTPISGQQQQQHQQQQQQKPNLQHHGLNRNPQIGAGGLPNQMGKQRQRQLQQQQQFQQSGRHQMQQRQPSQSSQQAKLLKGMGRGNMVMQQGLPVDHSHLNGISVPSGSQGAEKGEQIMHLVQGQGLYSGANLNTIQPSKPLVPSQSSNHSQSQQKLYPGTTNVSKHFQQMPSHSDNNTQVQVPAVPSGHSLPATSQAVPAPIMASNHQQLQQQPLQKQVNQAQTTVQRMLQPNRQVNSDLPTKSQTDQGHADQHPVNNVSQVGTSPTIMSQPSNDSTNVAPFVSAAVPPQWKASEPSYDSCMPSAASQVRSVGSSPVANSAGSEPVASTSQGLGQRQLSGGLPQHGHNAGTQWQPQPQVQSQPQVQQLTTPSQQPLQPQEPVKQEKQQSPGQRLTPQQQSQQQTQHIQSAQSSLYIRPTNSKLE